MNVSISTGDILYRYNAAFGYNAMKVAAHFIKLPSYSDTDSSYANMFFENRKTGKQFNFGVTKLGGKAKMLENGNFLAPPPLVDFKRAKHVVTTDVDRSNHTVIENFGNKAYKFSMRGLLIDMNEHHYPEQQLKEVHDMFRQNGTYKIASDIFKNLEIYEVFFDNIKFDFVEGFVDTVKFKISGMSVETIDFIV